MPTLLPPPSREVRLAAFAERWKHYRSTEQAGAQMFLVELLAHYEMSRPPGTIFEQHPVAGPPAGQGDLFGRRAAVRGSAERMDMFIPRICVWEMKAPDVKDLGAHHAQLLRYWSYVRTRYMVLCNFHEFWIYDTDRDGGHLTPAVKFPLSDLAAHSGALLFLRGEQSHFPSRPDRISAEMASELGGMARELLQLQKDGQLDLTRDQITWVILQSVFAMFAEDAELIPRGLFSRALQRGVADASMAPVNALFDDFAGSDGAAKTYAFAPYVNGTLYDRELPRCELPVRYIAALHAAATRFEWQDVRPEIFGSIFEQTMDAEVRHETGAHFTREADILRVIHPTIIAPWQQRIRTAGTQKDAQRVIDQMRAFHILDPACGCGNFLYVAYREMKRLEAGLRRQWVKAGRTIGGRRKAQVPPPPGPYFTINQVHGIEINGFAARLSRVVLWIGEYLAIRELGLSEDTLPLKNLDANVVEGDALFTPWPRPEGELAIVGNPPYLGVRKLRAELGDAWVERAFDHYPDNRSADLVTYWYTGALRTLRPGERAGFVSTNSITQNESRGASIEAVVAAGGSLVDAWRTYDWPGDAAVDVSIVNWVMGPYDGIRRLDGKEVSAITPLLTTGVDATRARTLPLNRSLTFMGVTPGNAGFVLSQAQREAIVADDPASARVIRPYLVGLDVNRDPEQRPARWIIDFGERNREQAERYVGAFRWVQREVYPERSRNRRQSYAEFWWRFVEARPGLRAAILTMNRCIVLARVSNFVLPVFSPTETCFDSQLYVIALNDWYHLGILQSRAHDLWTRTLCSTLEDRLRYTATTVFETFPFPLQPDGDRDPRLVPPTPASRAVGQAARRFYEQRGERCRELALGIAKMHRRILGGQEPSLSLALDTLNDAVDGVYGWPAGTWRDDEALLRRLVDLNRGP